MTDDIYNPTYEWCVPRPYHYYIVYCTVYNKYTEEYNTFQLYISLKRSLDWLMSLPVDLPSSEYFRYEYKLKEVEDRDDIVFHYIKSRDDWSRYLHRHFLSMCATSRWHISFKMTLLKYFKNFFKKPNCNLHKYIIQ